MAIPLVLAGLLSAFGGWLLRTGAKYAIAIMGTWALFSTDFGWGLVRRGLDMSGWDSSKIVMPALAEEWSGWWCAIDAWVPLAEMWTIGKLYLSFVMSSVVARLMFQVAKRK